jgi:hypothetical protein
MKYILLIILLCVTINVNADKHWGYIATLCHYASKDSVVWFDKRLRQYHKRLATSYYDVRCGQDRIFLYTWAHEHKANHIKRYLRSKMGSMIDDEVTSIKSTGK